MSLNNVINKLWISLKVFQTVSTDLFTEEDLFKVKMIAWQAFCRLSHENRKIILALLKGETTKNVARKYGHTEENIYKIKSLAYQKIIKFIKQRETRNLGHG
ncbi:MAG: hypothetical protein WC662_01650 [Candidatus Paceibacterota bacterium]